MIALADLMATQYSVESQISADPQSWIGIENIMKKESNSSFLYISYHHHDVFFWVLKTSGIIHFRTITVDENLVDDPLIGKLYAFFAKSFRRFSILAEEDCEDRCLNDVESHSALRLIEEEDEKSQYPESSVSLYYRMLISPVADLLKGRELIVVPDRSLNQVPFSALVDEDGRYLSETFRIRVVPSLTTLKHIQDSLSQSDRHTDSGGSRCWYGAVQRKEHGLFSVSMAGSEAAMITRLLGVQPLLGEKATKQVVLDTLH